MRARGDPGAQMDLEADIPLGRDLRLAGVQAHPDAQRAPREYTLSGGGGCGGSRRRREHEEERVALCVDLHASVRLGDRADQAAMLGERGTVRGTELSQQPRRALDVGEEERDRSGGKLGHGPSLSSGFPRDYATSRSFSLSASARSFFRLWFSICLIRSRVTRNVRPTSSSVHGDSPFKP